MTNPDLHTRAIARLEAQLGAAEHVVATVRTWRTGPTTGGELTAALELYDRLAGITDRSPLALVPVKDEAAAVLCDLAAAYLCRRAAARLRRESAAPASAAVEQVARAAIEVERESRAQ